MDAGVRNSQCQTIIIQASINCGIGASAGIIGASGIFILSSRPAAGGGIKIPSKYVCRLPVVFYESSAACGGIECVKRQVHRRGDTPSSFRERESPTAEGE